MDNIFEPESKVVDVQTDLESPIIQSFIGCLELAKKDPRRVKKMSSLEQDKELYDYLFDDLPALPTDKDFFDGSQTVPPMMKSSLYDHVFSKYHVDGNKLPRLRPVKEGMREVDLAIIDNLKDDTLELSGFNDLYKKEIFQKFYYEGCPVVQIGSESEEIMFDDPDLDEMYFDVSGTHLQSKSKSKKRCKWAIRAIELDRKTFNLYLRSVGREDLIDRVLSGTPVTTEDGFTADVQESVEPFNITDPVTLFFGTDIGQGEPTYCVFAGQSGTIIKLKQGKEYPFQKQWRGKFQPILPYDMFHFDKKTYRKGLYSMSMIGLIKDGAEALKKNLNYLLPAGAKAVNGYLFLFGSPEQRTIEDLMTYTNLQAQGVTPIIESSDPNTSMNYVSPDINKIWDAYEKMRKTILDDLGTRLRINLRIQEEVDQTATEFVGKSTEQNKQVSSLNANNSDTFEWIGEVSVDFQKKYSKKRKPVYFGLDLGDEKIDLDMNWETVKIVLSDWSGTFFADTDIKTPMSQPEKRQAIASTIGRLTELLQGMDYQTEDEIKPIVRSVFKEVVMNEMDDEISMADLNKMALSIINRRQPMQQPAIQGQSTEKLPTNEEMTKEMSPLANIQ